MSGGDRRSDAPLEEDAVTSLLGAYLDEELSLEMRERVRAHLESCAACRRELRAQRAVRARLKADALPSVSAELRGRVLDGLKPPATPLPGRERLRTLALGGGWLVAAALGAMLLWRGLHPAAPAMNMVMAPQAPVTVDPAPSPLVDSILTDFRRVADSELGGSLDLPALKARVPFSVPELRSSHMRLLGVWTTQFHGEPIAVLAYRCHNRLVLQYVISERLFFQRAEIRNAIARAGLYAAGEGPVNAVAWPGTDSGSLLVGEFSAAELAAMRT